MNRRKLLSAGPAVVVLVGAAARSAAAAAFSPVLDAARQLAALDRQHDLADAAQASGEELDRIMHQMCPLERSIIAAIPTTTAEAAVILMVATRPPPRPPSTASPGNEQ